MSFFDTVFERVIGSEGGYQANPEDRGNWTGGEVGKGKLVGTKFGLSAMTYPSLDIKNLTLSQAKEIYYKDWWVKLNLDKAPQAMAYQMFDAAFNHGTGRANQFLQQAVGVKADGIIGPLTIAAAGKIDPLKLVLLFIANRQEYFTNVKTWASFSKGWMRRMAEAMRFAADDLT
jgi:lysozyme family protein